MFTCGPPMWGGESDPFFAQVAFLISPKFYAVAGAPNDLSNTGRAATLSGTASVDSGVTLFGGNTLKFVADGDGWTYPYATPLNGAVDHCFEAFVRLSLLRANDHLFFSTDTPNPWWAIVEGATNKFGFASSGYAASNNPALAVDTWYHLAVTYEQATITRRFFVDGIARGSASGSSISSTSSGVFYVGKSSAGVAAPTSSLRGYLGGVRITIGNKRYPDAGFTALTGQFPRS